MMHKVTLLLLLGFVHFSRAGVSKDQWGDCLDDSAAPASTGNAGSGPVAGVAKLAGGVIGGIWGAVVPEAMNKGAINAACGKGVGSALESGNPLGKVAGAVGYGISSIWSNIMPASAKKGSIAGASTTGGVDDPCADSSITRKCNAAPTGSASQSSSGASGTAAGAQQTQPQPAPGSTTDQWGECVQQGSAGTAPASTGNAGSGPVSAVGKVAGGGVGGIWGAIVPEAMNKGAINAACGKGVGSALESGNPLGKVAGAVGYGISSIWSNVVPSSIKKGSIEGASATGGVSDPCGDSSAAASAGRTCGVAPAGATDSSKSLDNSGVSKDQWGDCVKQGSATASGTGSASTGNAGSGPVSAVGQVAGGGVGGIWGAIVPEAMNKGAINAACGKGVGSALESGNPLGKVAGAVGYGISSIWSNVVPSSIKKGSIEGAAATGGVADPCADSSAAPATTRVCGAAPLAANAPSTSRDQWGDCTQGSAASSGSAPASTGNAGSGPVSAVGQVAGGGVGGIWGAIVPEAMNKGAINAACGKGVGSALESGNPLGKVAGAVGYGISSIWSNVVPSSIKKGSIQGAATTGGVNDPCGDGSAAAPAGRTCGDAPAAAASSKDQWGDCTQGGAPASGTAQASTGNAGVGPVSAVGQVAGGGVGGIWGAIVPEAMNKGAINAACGKGVGSALESGNPLGKVAGAVGYGISSIWSNVVPSSIKKGSIQGAAATGGVDDPCADTSAAPASTRTCGVAPVAANAPSKSRDQWGDCTQGSAASSGSSPASTGNAGSGPVSAVGQVAGGGVGGIWGAIVPEAMNKGAINAACGKGVGSALESGNPLGKVAGAVGYGISSIWSNVVPSSVKKGSIQGAAATGGVSDPCADNSAATSAGRTCGVAPAGSGSPSNANSGSNANDANANNANDANNVVSGSQNGGANSLQNGGSNGLSSNSNRWGSGGSSSSGSDQIINPQQNGGTNSQQKGGSNGLASNNWGSGGSSSSGPGQAVNAQQGAQQNAVGLSNPSDVVFNVKGGTQFFIHAVVVLNYNDANARDQNLRVIKQIWRQSLAKFTVFNVDLQPIRVTDNGPSTHMIEYQVTGVSGGAVNLQQAWTDFIKTIKDAHVPGQHDIYSS